MKFYKLFLISVFFVLSGCAQHINNSQGQAQWDFDHKVQFKEKKLTPNTYHIEVIANGKANFSTLSTFLMRRSLDVCRSYGFKLEVLQGVESYLYKQSSPNLILSNLSANLECVKDVL